MMHDLSLTETHVVFYDLPVTFDAREPRRSQCLRDAPARAALLSAFLAASASGSDRRIPARFNDPRRRVPVSWDPNHPARVGVMPREGSNADVRWFEVEPCFVFHPLNAYDDGDTIVLDVVRHPKMFDRNQIGPSEGPADTGPLDHRSRRRQGARIAIRRSWARISARGRASHRQAASVWLCAHWRGRLRQPPLLKHDFLRNSTQSRCFGAEKAVGEFIFHPSSPDAAEDDGVVLGYAYDRSTDRSELAILDAQTLQSIASIKLPHRVPAGCCGSWVPTGR